jgi:predicted dehydrogenase
MQRREFLGAGLGVGAGMLLLSPALTRAQPAAETPPSDTLNVALIGAGVQGRALINAVLAIPNVRFRAVCDIWRYSRRSSKYYLETYKQEVNDYEDYQELLQKEKDLHAVLVATPDHGHAEHTNACLKAGLHVYCEKSMANTLDGARSMVRTMRETGKLLQIGYQRRSNPRYLHVQQNLLQKAKLTGRITHAAGQWNQSVREDTGWPKKFAMTDDDLKRHGYTGMHEFRNWRSFKKFGGGPLADFAAHQFDAVGWLLGVTPKSVLAMGGVDYYKTHEWYDNVTALIEYDTPDGILRGTFQVLTTTSGGGERMFEHVLGVDGSIKISENPKWTRIYREPHVPAWDQWVAAGYLNQPPEVAASKPVTSDEEHVRETGVVVPYELPVVLDKPLHQPHLENFFDAIRGTAKLNCPADLAFRTEVVVHKANEAVAAQKLLTFTPDEFNV